MFWIGVLFTGCSKKTPAENAAVDQAKMKDLFAALYLGDHGLDYPPSAEALQTCKTNNVVACLQVYERVKSAAGELVSMKSDDALSATFDVIRGSCGSADEKARNFICHGALMSFYFYVEPGFDSRILEFVVTLPPEIQSDIMNRGFAWFRNRPAPEQWIGYINGAPIEWQFDGSKEQTAAMFLNKSPQPLWGSE